MNIEIKEVTIKVSGSELYDIACDIFYALKHSIKEHYNCLQQDKDGEPVFYDMCSDRIKRMNKFYIASGYDNMPEHSNNEFKGMFAVKRKERKEASQ